MTPEQQHQHALFRQIRLPMLAGVGFFLAIVGALLLFSQTGAVSYQQIHCFTGGLLILCFFLPTVLLMLVFNFLLVLLALKAGEVPRLVRPPLKVAQSYADQGLTTTQQVSQAISAPIINARTQVAFWRSIVEQLLPIRPENPPPKD
jgi:hypothetical protein